MKTEIIHVSKDYVLSEVKKHSNYLTERSDSDRNYEMVRLYSERLEAIEEAWDEAVSMVVGACKLYARNVEREGDLTITLSIPTTHNEQLVDSIEKEASAVCMHYVLSAWYGIVLPTEVEAQRTIAALHLDSMRTLLDDRQAPQRKRPEILETEISLETEIELEDEA